MPEARADGKLCGGRSCKSHRESVHSLPHLLPCPWAGCGVSSSPSRGSGLATALLFFGKRRKQKKAKSTKKEKNKITARTSERVHRGLAVSEGERGQSAQAKRRRQSATGNLKSCANTNPRGEHGWRGVRGWQRERKAKSLCSDFKRTGRSV